MKKRICIVLLGIALFFTNVLPCTAENTDETATEPVAEENAALTATQIKAMDNQVDVDADIRDELEAEIPKQTEEILISNKHEFLEFAGNCKYDIWSSNKIVKLTDDISLLGTDFDGVPTFGGIFDGNGHTISGFNLNKHVSYCGLFSTLQKGGAICNLKVEGRVIPEGEQITVGGIVANNYGTISNCTFLGVVSANDYVGGIAAVNQLSGKIDHCKSCGTVHGVHYTGGITGENMGLITNCTNEASVNITTRDIGISVDAVSSVNKVVAFVKNLNKTESEAKEDVTITDTGGIAGESIGIIGKCINTGKIGYEHVGYNVGGIAGRQSGYLYDCTNSAKIMGRKDIGGIVGQAEPYITIDLNSDIAYQLTESIGKLHDSVSTALSDTKNQSSIITNRLSFIQKFTDAALDDVKFIASDTVDFANNVSGTATDAFSRVDYLMAEASKEKGFIDYTQRAVSNAGDSADNIEDALKHLDIENYLSGDELKQYQDAKKTLSSAEAQFKELYGNSHEPFYNYAVYSKKTEAGRTDFDYYLSSTGEPADYSQWSDSDESITSDISSKTNTAAAGKWKYEDGKSFPGDDERDVEIVSDAEVLASTKASAYAMNHYQSPVYGNSYDEDISIASGVIAEITKKYLPIMADDVRTDAIKAMDNLDSAADNLYSAGSSARSALSNVASRSDLAFPKFSAEYKQHTASFVDNMKGMNDHFGLLSSEMNNATGVLVDDLTDISDQFNNIMLLFTDAVDGVLEQDYTSIFEDESLEHADTTIDATVEGCYNYGVVDGDISVSGIAGTMAIEYDYDLESDITGIKAKLINTSYVTKCVLRGNYNCNDISSEKNYAGGICGLQEMGIILNSQSIGNATSRSGEYVGGICGRSLSYIDNTCARGILSGSSYVGGIVGDGKHIQKSSSLVKITNQEKFYGAIAGHVSEDGIVRDNFFLSDELAGIDKVSYSMKAEPFDYNKNTVSDVFKKLTVSYVLTDDSLPNGQEVVQKANINFGETLSKDMFPVITPKEGYYVVWDDDTIENITTDKIVTASYKKYRSTISEDDQIDGKDFYQSEILVDGMFKEGDSLQVEKDKKFTLDNLDSITNLKDFEDYETINLKIPDDGKTVHQVRFSPQDNLADIFEGVDLYLIDGDNRTLLEKKATLGKYDIYEIEGNDLTLSVRFSNAQKRIGLVIAILVAIVIVLLAIFVLTVFLFARAGKKLPGVLNRLTKDVTKKIESKETIFYDDSSESMDDKKSSDESMDETENEAADEAADETENKQENPSDDNE